MTEKQNGLSQSLKRYIDFRTKQLDYEESQIGQPSGLSMGSSIARREAITMARWTLHELSNMTGWLDSGEPEYEPPLSADEKEFWRKAAQRGIDIPGDIKAQLSD